MNGKDKKELETVWKIRTALNDGNVNNITENLIKAIITTKNNQELLDKFKM